MIENKQPRVISRDAREDLIERNHAAREYSRKKK